MSEDLDPSPWPQGPPPIGGAPDDAPDDAPGDAPDLGASAVPDGEAGLIRRAQAGDHQAFRVLYEANAPTVFAFLARRVDRATAEDLTAETFTRAWERLDRFEWRGVPIRAWLLRIARNLVVARARRRSSGEVTTDDPRPDPDLGYEDALVDRLGASSRLGEALASLTEAQRTIVELRFLRDLSVGEAAVAMEVNEEAVRALTYRALRTLRSQLA